MGGGEVLARPDNEPDGMSHEITMVPDDGPGGLFPTGEYIPAVVETAREEARDSEPFAGAGYAPPPIFLPLPVNVFCREISSLKCRQKNQHHYLLYRRFSQQGNFCFLLSQLAHSLDHWSILVLNLLAIV